MSITINEKQIFIKFLALDKSSLNWYLFKIKTKVIMKPIFKNWNNAVLLEWKIKNKINTCKIFSIKVLKLKNLFSIRLTIIKIVGIIVKTGKNLLLWATTISSPKDGRKKIITAWLDKNKIGKNNFDVSLQR